MTNFEKYKDEILRIATESNSNPAKKDGVVVACEGLACTKCDFDGVGKCRENRFNWLYEDDGEEPDGCNGCIYEDEGIDEYPCTKCRNNYTNKFRRRPKKTRQDEFLEHYPDAALDSEGALKIAPCWIERAYSTSFCEKAGCSTCQRDYWLQEVEE